MVFLCALALLQPRAPRALSLATALEHRLPLVHQQLLLRQTGAAATLVRRKHSPAIARPAPPTRQIRWSGLPPLPHYIHR